MKTYQQRTSGNQPSASGAGRAGVQPHALQRAIDNGARMQGQRQQVNAVLQAKPKWLKNLLYTAKETTTAHSPGIYTGPVSAVGYGALGTNGANFQAIKDSKFKDYPTASANIGYTTTAASMLGDAVGAAFSAKAMWDNSPFRESTNWKSADYAKRREARAAFNSAATDLSGQALDAGSQISSTLGNVSQAGAVAAQVAPFGSGVVNLGVGIRAAVSAGRAGTYYNRLDALAKEGDWPFLNDLDKKEAPLQKEVEFTRNQMLKRRVRQGIGAAGAFLGTGGAIALGVAGVCAGAAVMATPVGWALAGAGAAVALGIGAYKAYRYIKKKGAASDKTNGAERKHNATQIIDALRTDLGVVPLGKGEEAKKKYEDKLQLRRRAEALLAARGINKVDKLRAADRDESIKYLERKLKSW